MKVVIDETNWGWVLAGAIALIWITFQVAEWVRGKEAAERVSTAKRLEAERTDREVSRLRSIFADNLNQQTKEIEKAAIADARAELREWKSVYGAKVRQDAVNRSKAVIAGKVAENIAPYLPMFPYNPKDARFLGSPIDFVIFDGLDEGELTEIVFLEVKSQGSRMSEKQKQIESVINNGNVFFEELKIDGQFVELDLSSLPMPEDPE